jgi:hypothetical protein
MLERIADVMPSVSAVFAPLAKVHEARWPAYGSGMVFEQDVEPDEEPPDEEPPDEEPPDEEPPDEELPDALLPPDDPPDEDELPEPDEAAALSTSASVGPLSVPSGG